MAKIEDVIEVLFNEIKILNKKLLILNRQLKNISDVKPDIDVHKLNNLFGQHEMEIKKIQSKFIFELDKKIEPDKPLYSKIQKFITGLLILISLLSLVYTNYSLTQIKHRETQAYHRGINDMKNHFRRFFKAYPKSKISYNKWLNKNL